MGFLQSWLVGWYEASRRGGSSCLRAQGPGTQAHQLWHMHLAALCHVDLPGPGMKYVSPELAGRFFSTVPPGQSNNI